MKFKPMLLTAALTTILLSSMAQAQAPVHETPQPEAPAVVGKHSAKHAAAKPEAKQKASAKKKHKAAKKSSAKKGKKKPAKSTKHAKHAVH